jgi:hypothetical protein
VSSIELAPEGSGYRLRIGDAVAVSAPSAFEAQDDVSCIVSGYERVGVELVADSFSVDDDPFAWELEGNCAFSADFAYASA